MMFFQADFHCLFGYAEPLGKHLRFVASYGMVKAAFYLVYRHKQGAGQHIRLPLNAFIGI